ncbi:hypothetical protein AWB75_05037 [Caballeronia catudaia]|uniref:Lipoprotein n=1 Tax=Caballeronia catudaia TaxID=1777136 RepID=A0A158CHA4_9BURK|nr:hypothetical protein [Caballeronia catudaia]SAK80907.1 hypothetical protein AWB75_05037 [Caballeronia catudaia]
MIRFFYFAVAALTLAVCVEHALAQSLSPSFGPASSRFDGSASANVKNPPAPPKSPIHCHLQGAQSPQSLSAGLPGTTPQRSGSIAILPDGSSQVTQQSDDKGSQMPMQSQQLDCARD